MSARGEQPEPQPCEACRHPGGTVNWGISEKLPYWLCENQEDCVGRLIKSAVPAKPKPVRKTRTGSRSRKTAAAGEAT